jgi:DNA-binding transcriptional LysR family regulator
MSIMDWNLARAFCATAECGSLSAAARKLNLTQPTLSRQVASLEAALGVLLFERLGKRLALTGAGTSLLEPARAMTAAADAFMLAAAGTSQETVGRVSISATDAISSYLLPEVIERIRRSQPQISIVVVASNALSDLRRREADIAIRHVRPQEPDLIARLIGEMAAHFYAADAWIARNGAPRDLAALCDAGLLAFEPVEEFVDRLNSAGIPVAKESIGVSSESAVVLWEMVRSGLGVCLMLRQIAERMQGITRLLPELPGIPVPVWLVCHRELRTNHRVRLVFDMLASELDAFTAEKRKTHGGASDSSGRD